MMFAVKVVITIYLTAIAISKSNQSYINWPKIRRPQLNKCKQESFDAAGFIQGNFTLFKDKFFWQPAKANIAMDIHSIWRELPDNRARVNAVHERHDGQVWFFIGREIYIFDGQQFKQKLSLQDIGIDPTEYSKVKAIFQWPDKDHTFIMSGEDYWRLNGSKVYDGYPQKIRNVWKGASQSKFGSQPEIDTVFSNGNQLFALSGTVYYDFDFDCMEWKADYESTDELFWDCYAPYETIGVHSVDRPPYQCGKPDFEAASEDAQWIMNFFNNPLSCN